MTQLLPQGNLVTLVGFDPSGNIVPLQVTADGYLLANYEQAGSGVGAMIEPKGNLVSPVAYAPNGDILPLQVTADGYLRIAVSNQPASDLVLIEDKIVAAAGATLAFDNIPQTYKHLKLIGSVRASIAGGADFITAVFNDDTGNNYDSFYFNIHHNAVLSTLDLIAAAYARLAIATGNNAGANDASAFEVNLPSYSQTTLDKSYVTPSFVTAARSATNLRIYYVGGQWRSTSAISKISLAIEGGSNFMVGSRISLYGLK